jgi:5,10-methylenetetrahydromethanopterin reductase
MTSVWRLGVALPRLAARQAEAAEAEGWDGLLLTDSQNLAGDVYAGLTEAALATSRIGLGTGVTNPVTRHPAVTAGSIATVHALSGGRAVLGIGRGDSSLAHLGLAPAGPAAFERYVVAVRRYLRREEVPFDDARSFAAAGATIDDLPLAGAPSSSRLHWLRKDLAPVPVDVAATGPKVLALAGRSADRVTLAVGADLERMRWAIDQVRTAGAGRGDGPPVGAFVNVVVHPDVEVARELASGSLSTFARFSVMHGRPSGPVSEDQEAVLRQVSGAYDMTRHTQAGSPQASVLASSDFADRFAVLGPAGHCVERLRALVGLGLDRLVVIGASANADRAEVAAANRRFVDDVLPALQGS